MLHLYFFFIILGIFSISYGQSTPITRYTNEDYGITITHPSDWAVSEYGLASYQIVRFVAPEVEKEETSTSIVVFTPAEFTVAAQPVEANKTVDEFFQDFLTSTYPSPTDYRIIESSSSQLLGQPAKQVIMYEYGGSSSKVMRLITFSNNTAYMIKYTTDPGSFDEYLPIAESMAASLNIINASDPSFVQQNTTTNTNQRQIEGTNVGVSEVSIQDQNSDASSISKAEQNTSFGTLPLPTQNQNDNLPSSLTVKDDSFGEAKLPLRSTITNNQASPVDFSGSTTGTFNDWYPRVTFQFDGPVGIGLVNIEHLLIGPIKSYESAEDVLAEALYYRNIPFNQQVVTPLDHSGLNYLIASVKFANGQSGVYSSVMNADTIGTKSAAEDYLGFLEDEGDEFLILDESDIEELESAPLVLSVASQLICDDLKDYGFNICSGTSNTVNSQTPTNSNNNNPFSLFDQNSESNDEDNDDDNDEEN